MTDQRILHVLVPGEQVSPFDLTMALDAGYDTVLPYTGVRAGDVTSLVQDAIFSRPPKRFARTGVLIAGHDVNLATRMLEWAQSAMVPPFEVALYADPNGAYSTAAAVVAMVEQTLDERASQGVSNRKVAILGTGPVGLSTAVLTAKLGAQPTLCQLTGNDDVHAAESFCEHYGVAVPWVPATSLSDKIAAVEDAAVVVSAAKAGIQVLPNDVMSRAKELVVAADLNAVPPSGIEGIGAMDSNVPIDVADDVFFALGALAIGDVKYKLQKRLFRRMLDEDQPAAVIDFMGAYDEATKMLNRHNVLATAPADAQAASAS